MLNFKRLRIWQKGFDIAVNSYLFTRDFPKEEKFGLCSQINRAAVSIPSNIAEGSSRTSQKDYMRFLEISLGSSYEMETQVLIADAINMGDQQLKNYLLKELDEEQKMLMSFMRKLSKP
jgi:four helix bundle protein